MSVLPQFRAGEPTPARYGVCVLLGLIGIFVAGAMFQIGASTPVGLFVIGASTIGSAGWFGLAWLEATELDELEGSR